MRRIPDIETAILPVYTRIMEYCRSFIFIYLKIYLFESYLTKV